MTGPDVDAVVVAYDSRDDIGPCLASLENVPGLGATVVVDHGTDGSAQVAFASGATVITDPTNPGFGAGHNRGMSETSAPFVLMMNPDARMVPGAVAEGLRVLAGHPEVAAIQGVVTDAGTGRPERSHGVALGPLHLWGRALRLRALLGLAPVRALARRVGGLTDHVERVPAGPVDTEALGATALLVRREAFESVGGFDEDFFLYGEDMDLSRRFRAAGWSLVSLPIPWATHRAGSSHRSSWEREVQWWRGTMTYAAQWFSAGEWGMAVGAAAVRAATLGARRPSEATGALKAMVVEPWKERRERRIPSGHWRPN